MFKKKKLTKKKQQKLEARKAKLAEVKEFIAGLIDLIVVFAQASASYVLYFNGTEFLQVVAVIIAIRALVTASNRFVTNK